MVQHQVPLDLAFGALSDGTRRGVLERLRRGEASIGELAADFRLTLTGMRKHVRVLEGAGLVVSQKVGRVRRCRIGPGRLGAVAAWIEKHRQMQAERLDHLARFLKRTEGDPS
jgi:DNA-binding transcriptional ArsR family regulator